MSPASPKHASATSATSPAIPLATSLFALVMGFFLFFALVKWGNPVVLDAKSEPPKGLLEIIYMSWPTSWAFGFIIPVVIFGIASIVHSKERVFPHITKGFHWVIWLPLLWFGWQLLSTSQSVDGELTFLTMRHFAVCTALFYLGCFAMRGRRNDRLIWLCLILALACVMRAGFEQHFGGLEEVRKVFYQQPNWQQYPEEYIRRINSNRIFGTFCYANSLAGALLLLLPVSIVFLWRALARFIVTRVLVVAALAGAGAACFYWTGSKAGWLLAVIVGMVVLWNSALPKMWKRLLIVGLVILGLAGFALRFSGYFQKGSTSVTARFDYWKAGVQNFAAHPILGSGPGTFYVQYQKYKAPESEMTRLCHNDYLQQAGDSGLPGFLFFTGWIVAGLVLSYRQMKAKGFDPVQYAVWLGLLGISLHSFVDFHLYIPGLAWTYFFLFGWLFASVCRETVQESDSI